MSGIFDYIPEVLNRAVEDAQPIDVKGKVIQMVGTIIKASVPGVKVGEVCILRNPWEDFEVQAEVVGFTKDAALLTALGPMIGISAETEVIPTRRVQMVPVGMNLLGRVLDGLGRPLDAETKGPLRPDGYYPVYAPPPSPLERRIISKPISLGIRAIDGLLTCGEGQRMGIFAAAGGGKSTLLASIIRNTEAEVTVLAVDGEGLITAEQVARAIRPDTILVAVQFANNEIGTIQPIAEIATVAKERGVACFVDAVQAVGHLPFALGSTEGAGKLPLGATPRDYEGITMLSASAHKFGGPKGVGFLFVREGTKLAPVLHGGPQEMHLRAGTENVPGIVGTAAALIVSCRELRENLPRVRALRDMMMHRITGEIPDSRVNGSRIHRLAGNVNVSFSGVEASSILVLMDMAGIACSGGSACSSASGKPSHVIEALHIPHEYENGTVRLTISPDTTQAEIDGAVTALAGIVAKLREGRKV